MSRVIASFCVLAGAVLAYLFYAFASYETLLETMRPRQPGDPIEVSNLVYVGLAGVILLGLSLLTTACVRRAHTTVSTVFLAISAAFFFLAAPFIFFGTWRLYATLQKLASAGIIDADMLIAQAETAELPLRIGWGLVVLGAGALLGADLAAKQPTDSEGTAGLPMLPTALAGLTALVLLLSSLWNLSGWSVVAGAVADIETPDPARLAGGLMAQFLSGFLISFSFLAIGLVTVLMLVVSGGRAPQQVGPRPSEPEASEE